jgi:hypothetical protein
VSSATITFCVASQGELIVVIVYFIIDSVQKLLGTPLYILLKDHIRSKHFEDDEAEETSIVAQTC